MSKKMLCTMLMSLALCTAGYTQTVDKAKLDQFFDRLLEKNKAMGSLIIAQNGKALYTRTIGYSQINGTEKKPLTMVTKYRIGSVTKMFTATMILQLVEEGKLKLTDTLGKFFPQIPNAGKISIAHLLAHRSGIHGVNSDQVDPSVKTKGITKEEKLALIAKGKPDFEPGEKYAYSNAGYFLLGLIVEKLTGQSYQEALNKRILAKLALTDTYAGTGEIDPGKNESFSYRYFGEWKQDLPTHISIPFGAGSLISTAPDMATFIKGLFDGKLFSKKTLELMTQNKYGIETFEYNGKTFYGHGGGIDNFGSWLAYLPEEKLVLSYATNGKVYPVPKMIDDIFNIYYNKPFTIPDFATMAISPDILDKYVGVYSSPDAPAKFTITRKDSTLFVKVNEETPVPLEPTSDNSFKIDGAPIVIQFDAAKKQMTVIRNGRERIFTKES